MYVSTVFGMGWLRDSIIERLDKFVTQYSEPLEIIAVARRCGVTKWLEPQYVRLCERHTPLTAEEGGWLGFERFAAVCRVREKRINKAAKKLKQQKKIPATTKDWVRSESILNVV